MPDSAFLEIALVQAEEQPFILPGLVHLLQNTVASGASVGFLPPLNNEDAQNYWNEIFQDVGRGTKDVLCGDRQSASISRSTSFFATIPTVRAKSSQSASRLLSNLGRR